jgi:anti-sigma-K factor RskA
MPGKQVSRGIERIRFVRFTAINAAAIVAAAATFAGMQTPAHADDSPAVIAVGAKAPAVVGKSTFDGKIEDYDMSKALAGGAVVLYFFPKAFTAG